ncbi:hypothetical protein CH330_05670 [candidate division WOR-3 bacterium JGI_Cruoil_03_51_56]|uniref:Uncharacterized protein n=1 Tax=candidate division WOR-3 bacterium JGI_Cruoil_03_51_56 TaxID=1973747 RepID=A0A235BT97_UNCW3|nr:MAG: hypothetical protein CH330_05670 [candidate division WOR-3 bacterium JGI_Cruoil_03_51_56]
MRLTEAAKKLGLHPCEVVLELAKVFKSLRFEEICPEVSDDYVNTLAKLVKPTRESRRAATRVDTAEVHKSEAETVRRLPDAGKRLVRAMHRKKYYEGNRIPEDKIRNQYLVGQSKQRQSSILKELVQMEVLHRVGKTGSFRYSLNKKKKKLIEKVSGST